MRQTRIWFQAVCKVGVTLVFWEKKNDNNQDVLMSKAKKENVSAVQEEIIPKKGHTSSKVWKWSVFYD